MSKYSAWCDVVTTHKVGISQSIKGPANNLGCRVVYSCLFKVKAVAREIYQYIDRYIEI